MYKINDEIKVQHKRLFNKVEILKGKIICIRHFEGEDSEGYGYSMNSYHLILENGKRIIVIDEKAHPPYYKTYKLLQ